MQETRAERNIRWIETYIKVPEGRFVGRPLVMTDYMREDFRAIYDNPHGTRVAIISRGRKNAKTTEAAMILLLHLIGPEARPNSSIYSGAQSRDQAGLVFKLACKMIRMSPVLSRVVKVIDSGKKIKCEKLGTEYTALSADAATAFGLSPVLIIHDELGQVKGPSSELYEALETATAAQEDPLSIVISTQAPLDKSLLSVLIDDAQTSRDPRTVLRFDTAPIDLDPFDIETVRLANPGLFSIMNKDEVMRMAAEARALPSKEASFRNLVLNQRVEVSNPLFGRSTWEENAARPLPLDDLTEVYLGLDLSSSLDLTAAVAIYKVDGVWSVLPTFWMPLEGIAERSRQDRVPYDVWHKQGFLRACPGRTVSYEFVAAWLFDFCSKHNVKRIAFDRWNFVNFRPWLVAAGFSEAKISELFYEFGQGFKSMSPAIKELEADVVDGLLAHGNHPVLSMCIANTRVTSDPAGNRKLDKQRATGRIDGAVALAMARGIVPLELKEVDAAPEYNFYVL